MSFKEDKIPIESQLMLDYVNGLPFRDCLAKYREYLADYLVGPTDCWRCITALKTYEVQ